MLIAPKNMRAPLFKQKQTYFKDSITGSQLLFVENLISLFYLSVGPLGGIQRSHFIPLLSCQFFFSYLFWHFYSLSSIWKPATEREWSWIVGPSFASYLHADGHPHFLPHASPWPQIRPALVPRRLLRGRLERLRRTKWWTRTKNLLLHFLYVHAVCYSLR